MFSRLSRVFVVFSLLLAAGFGSVAARPIEPVDVNRASFAELMQVPGMTAIWAQRIVRFRPYRTKLNLVEHGVVTPEAYARIRDGIVAHRAGRNVEPDQKPY